MTIDAERRRSAAELGFHAALVAVVLPIVSLPFVWAAAAWNARTPGEEDQTRWTRRLVLLAIVDTFVALALVATSFFSLHDGLDSAGEPGPYAQLAAIVPFVLVGLAIGTLAWLGHTRDRQLRFWIPFVVILLSMPAAGWLGGRVGRAIAGSGVHADALGLLVNELVLVALVSTWFAIGGAHRARGDERPRWTFARTYPTGMLYAFAWLPRVMWLSVPWLWAASRLGIGAPSPILTEVMGQSGSDAASAVPFFLAVVVFAPIAEELLFRGLLFSHLARSFGAWPAMYVSGVLFGLLHVGHGALFVGPLTLGLLLGWARLRSHGLAAPIAMHVSFNAFATLVTWST